MRERPYKVYILEEDIADGNFKCVISRQKSRSQRWRIVRSFRLGHCHYLNVEDKKFLTTELLQAFKAGYSFWSHSF